MQFGMISLLALAWSAVMATQAPDASCCRMEVSTPVNSTKLSVSVTNLELAQVSVIREAVEFALRIQIRGENGQESPLTDIGKRLLEGFRGGSRVRTALARNETLTEVIDLRKLYELAPGTYEVTVRRDVFMGERRVELQAKTSVKVQ